MVNVLAVGVSIWAIVLLPHLGDLYPSFNTKFVTDVRGNYASKTPFEANVEELSACASLRFDAVRRRSRG